MRSTVVTLACLAAACSSNSGGGDTWELVVDDHEGGLLLSVLPSDADDVWAVGGRTGETLILRGDAGGFDTFSSPGADLAWWVCDAGDARIVVGAGGMVLRFADSDFEVLDLGITGTLYGCWGTSPNDFWVVGGDPFLGPAELVHVTDGVGEAPDLGPLLADVPRVFFKIDGAGDWLFLSTDDGAIFTRNPSGEWAREVVAQGESLFTVSAASADDVWAVGGQDHAVAVHYDGSDWSDESLEDAPGLFGVSATKDEVLAVGMRGTVLRYTSTGFVEQDTPTTQTLHSVAQDGSGHAWAAGGNVLEPNDSALRGVVLRR